MVNGIIFLTVNSLGLGSEAGRATLSPVRRTEHQIISLCSLSYLDTNHTATPASTHQPPRALETQPPGPEALSSLRAVSPIQLGSQSWLSPRMHPGLSPSSCAPAFMGGTSEFC